MQFGLRQKIFGIYSLVFAVSVLLTADVHWHGRAAIDAAIQLVDRDIPMLRTLSDFKADVAALEPIVYQYYVTRNRETFLIRKEANRRSIERGLRAVRAAFPHNQRLDEIDRQYEPIKALVERLDDTLNTTPINWDQARFLLIGISNLCMGINGNVGLLAESIHKSIAERGAETQRIIDGIALVVAIFSALLFAVTLIGGYHARGYLVESEARRRLATFPERNPNPVFSLAEDGTVRYANPGAMDALRRLDAASGDVDALLPADLSQWLAALKASGRSRESWEYTALGRTFCCDIHHVEDYGEFHAYLSDISERKRAKEQLVYLAYHDAMTGLPNRRRFLERLDEAVEDAGNQSAILLLCLDRFKFVTESLGHAVGNHLLAAAAQRLGELIKQGGEFSGDAVLYRFEGELFAILASRLVSPDAPALLAAHVAALMETPLPVDGRTLFGTFSIGVTVFPGDGTNAELLVKNAEAALHRVIRDGGNGFQCYSREMSARALQRLELEGALRQALNEGTLEVRYQPQVEVARGRIVGAEALAHWRHPTRGMVSPAEFISLAEETGLIAALGESVLRTACAQNKAWQDAGWPPMTVAVNISARQFRGNNLPEVVRQVLHETGLDPRYLELEVTESAAMHDVEATIAMLQMLQSTGVSISIDDFGIGHSSLAYLKRFPLDKLKVDQSFIRNMEGDANDAAIVRSVIALGHSMKLKVLAEGVETEAQRDLLERYECDEMQGYLFSRPLTAHLFAELLAQQLQPVAHGGMT